MKKGPCVGFRPLKLLWLWKTNTCAGWVVWGWGVKKHRISFRGPPIDKVMWEVLPEWPSPEALSSAAWTSHSYKIKHSLLLWKCFLESPWQGAVREGVGWEGEGETVAPFAWETSREGTSRSYIPGPSRAFSKCCPVFRPNQSVVTLK